MSKLVEIAFKYIDCPSVPYIGPDVGNNPKGFDCSGFVQWVLKESKIEIPRISNWNELRHSEQFFDFFGVSVHPQFIQKGDLMFFSRNGYRPSHIGIYLGEDKMIHSPGKNNQKVCIYSISDFCKENPLIFSPKDGFPQIYSENPIGYKRVSRLLEDRYQEFRY